MTDTEKVWEAIIAVILAVSGGLARLLNAKDAKRLHWSRIFSELFISGFAGLMSLLLARSMGLTGDWLGLVSGVAGWMGPRILNLLAAFTVKTVGIQGPEEKSK